MCVCLIVIGSTTCDMRRSIKQYVLNNPWKSNFRKKCPVIYLLVRDVEEELCITLWLCVTYVRFLSIQRHARNKIRKIISNCLHIARTYTQLLPIRSTYTQKTISLQRLACILDAPKILHRFQRLQKKLFSRYVRILLYKLVITRHFGLRIRSYPNLTNFQ